MGESRNSHDDMVSRAHATGFSGLHATLLRLRALGSLGLTTNGSTAHQQATIRALNVEHFFSTILVSEDEGIRKPDVRIFHRASIQLGVSPGESVYVGDHPEVDIDAPARRE